MRFRARLSRDNVQEILAVIHSVEKVGSVCALHLTKTTFEIRTPADDTSDVGAFVSLQTSHFLDYRIERATNNDEISLEVSLKNLSKGLKSADLADACVLKLARKNGLPCLSIVAETVTAIQITQDVPVSRILSESEMLDFREPTLPQPSISLHLPDVRSTRTVLDRMKALDKFVTVVADVQDGPNPTSNNNSSGTISFKVQTEVVSMLSTFQGLQVLDCNNGGRRGARVRARVNVKELLSVLQLQSVNAETMLLCIVERRALVLYVILEGRSGTETFYVPLAEDDNEAPEQALCTQNS